MRRKHCFFHGSSHTETNKNKASMRLATSCNNVCRACLPIYTGDNKIYTLKQRQNPGWDKASLPHCLHLFPWQLYKTHLVGQFTTSRWSNSFTRINYYLLRTSLLLQQIHWCVFLNMWNTHCCRLNMRTYQNLQIWLLKTNNRQSKGAFSEHTRREHLVKNQRDRLVRGWSRVWTPSSSKDLDFHTLLSQSEFSQENCLGVRTVWQVNTVTNMFVWTRGYV